MGCAHIIANLLKDAYAMEQAVIETLEQHSNDTEDVELKSRLEDKAESVHDNAEKIKVRVEELDHEVSTAKTGLASVIKNMEEYPSGFEKGRLIKDAIIEYGVEHFEKGTFKAILFAARECKDEKTLALCEKLIGNEIETSEYLDQNLNDAITDYINKETAFKDDLNYTGEDEDSL